MSSAPLRMTRDDAIPCPVLMLLNDMFSGGFVARKRRSVDPLRLPSWHLSTRRTDGRISILCCGYPEDCELETFLAWGRTGIDRTATPGSSSPATEVQ